jgi:nucleotide-binding universal stress UspA family protein
MRSTVYKKIMIATDGSELVRKAVDSAIEIAKLSEAQMYAIHVIVQGGYSITPYINAEWEKAMKEHLWQEGQEATAYVENVGRASNVEVKSIILEGSPAVEIIDFAEKNDIDLIVMGSHGKSAIKRFLIGSVAEKVVKHSKIEVLVVRKETAENVLLNLVQVL